MLRRLSMILGILGCGLAAAGEPVRVELILDASGSMGNKLEDGRYRISAAKEVLEDLASSLPDAEGLAVGLRVYGSRVKYTEAGACDDSELFVPIEGVDRPSLLGVVRGARAIGATPIARSLELAAADLSGSGRKLVVLVTDGEESCHGDVKAAAARLRASGGDVDLRIVGIGLEKSAVDRFREIAPITNTNDARALGRALGEALATAAPAERRGFEVRASLTLNGRPVAGAKVGFVAADGVETPLAESGEAGVYAASLAPGVYRARVDSELAKPASREIGGLSVRPGGASFVFELAPPAEVRLTVEPASPVAGALVTIAYAGAPGVDGQSLLLAPVGEPEGMELPSFEEASGAEGSAQRLTPDEPGELEARFFVPSGEAGRVLAGRSSPFRTRAVPATLKAPARVEAGGSIPVEWTGPDSPDMLVIAEAGTAEGWIDYGNFASTEAGSPATLAAPGRPGRYEIRYITGQSLKTLARAEIELTGVEATLAAPEIVAAGSDFQVYWKGPQGEGDAITLVKAAAEATEVDYGNQQPTKDAVSPAAWRAPNWPGRYELRFVHGGAGGFSVWAKSAFEVTDVEAEIRGPATARAGQVIEVNCSEAHGSADHITLVPAGAEDGEASWGRLWKLADESCPMNIELVEEPGRYELRYILLGWDGTRTLARSPLTVE